MKKLNLILAFLIGLLIFSCSSDSTLLAQEKYKGAPKHKELSIEVLPYSIEYTIDQGLENNLKLRLDQQIHNLFEQHTIAGITATILVPEKGIWQTNKGFISKPDNIVVDSSSVFYWASVGKLVTSTIVHQLIIEDKLSLEDKLSKWFPDIQYAKKISIEQLLNHTNGIYSFNADPNFHYSEKDDSPIGLLEISKNKKKFI